MQTNSCPASLASGASCSISVTFTSEHGGETNRNMTITDNAKGGTQSVQLSGIRKGHEVAKAPDCRSSMSYSERPSPRGSITDLTPGKPDASLSLCLNAPCCHGSANCRPTWRVR